MTKIEYLLTCLMEELGEGATEIANLLETQFHDVPVAYGNEALIPYVNESNDIIACVELLIDNKVLTNDKFMTQDFEQTLDDKLFNTSIPIGSQLIVKHLNAQKAVSKMLRFGVRHTHPQYGIEGTSVLTDALLSLFASNRSLRSRLKFQNLYDLRAIKAKKDKVYKYLHIAMAEGRVLSYEFPGLS